MTASQKPMIVSPVKSAMDAKELWNQFHNKYKNLQTTAGVVAPGKFADVVLRRMSQAKAEKLKTKAPDSKSAPKVTLSKDDAANKIKKAWRDLRSTGKPVAVRLGKKHNPMMHFVLHKQNVKQSLHRDKLIQLKEAVDKGNVVAPIFNDPLVAELALKLFLYNKIQEQQFFSILDRVQIAKQYQLKKYYRILDEHGQFTKEAKAILLKNLQDREYLRPLTAEEIESFRQLVLALPISEQYFFTSDLGPYCGRDLKGTFLKNLLDVDALQREQVELIHLPFGAHDALGLACHGLKEYVRPVPQLGLQTNNDTEAGVRQKVRPTAMYFPGVKPFRKIHGNAATYLEARAHDFYHANNMSIIPDQLLEVLLRFVDLTRALGFKWSKEIYQWIDCEFNYFFHNNKLASRASDPYRYLFSGEEKRSLYDKSYTQLLCDMLMHANTHHKTRTGGYLVTHNQITPAGMMIFLNMVMDPQAWQRLQINPAQLTSPFKEYYQAIQKIYPLIKDDEPRLKLLKCFYCLSLEKLNAADAFPVFNEMINNNRDVLVAKMRVLKITDEEAKLEDPEIKNMLKVGLAVEDANCDSLNIVFNLEFKRLFGKHKNFDERKAYDYFGNAILKDGYNYKKAVHYAALRLDSFGDTLACAKAHWASMFGQPNQQAVADEKASCRVKSKAFSSNYRTF